MLRDNLIERQQGTDAIRWRSTTVSRLEGFSDAVFAFGITLLIVSLEVPATFDDLVATMIGFGAFGVCFGVVGMIWYQHYLFFRRFGLHDKTTHVLNMMLLFVVLFYMYPLKFMATFLLQWYSTRSIEVIGSDGAIQQMIGYTDVPVLTMIYSIGYGIVFLIFGLLYRHAYRRAELLNLTEEERHLTRSKVYLSLVHTAVALLSVGLCLVLPYSLAFVGGVIYFLIGPLSWWVARRFEQQGAAGAGVH